MGILGSLNWVDVTIALVLLISGLAGLFRGFVKESTTFGVWFFSFLGAWLFSSALGSKIAASLGEARYEKIREKFGNDSYLDFLLRFVGGLIIFVILLIFLQIVVSVFTARVRFKALSSLDKILGLLFGLIRGLLLLSLVWYFFHHVMAITQKSEQNAEKSYIQTIENSLLLPVVKISTFFVKPFLDPLIPLFSKSPDIDYKASPSSATEETTTVKDLNSDDLLIGEAAPMPATDETPVDTTPEPVISDAEEPVIGDAEEATERAITPVIGNGQAIDELPAGIDDEINNILGQ